MSPRCARITLLLALVPLVFASFIVDCVAMSVSSLHGPSVASTIFSIAFVLATWKRYVRWTIARSASTAGLTLATVAQVVIWRPLWDIGCMRNELCTAQSLAAFGLWAALSALLWWGALLMNRGSGAFAPATPRKPTMSPNAVRLVIGMALIPFMPGFFYVSYNALEDVILPSWGDAVYVSASYAICAAIAVAVWLLLWHRSVAWTATRRTWTTLLACVLLLSPILVLWADLPSFELGRTLLALGPLFAWSFWLAGTAWLWRTDRFPVRASGARSLDLTEIVPYCPRCEYNLTGLHEVRCPECGWSSTIDDLFARTFAQTAAVP